MAVERSTLLAPAGGAWRRLEAFVDARSAPVVCFAAALAAYGIQAAAWPLAPGRDMDNYLMYYLDMWSGRPALPELMLFRTPVAPLFFGPLLQLGGPVLVEVVMGFAYAISILAFVGAARVFGRRCALVTAIALLLYPGYGALFHQVSSDSIFALLVALWTFAVVRTGRRPTTWKFAALGGLLLLLVLARPSAQLLILFALVPLALGAPWRRRLVWAGVFLGTSVTLLAAWAGTNDLRYGDFTVARAGPAAVPFYRVFVLDRLVAPENGKASRELASAVQKELLPYSPYREYGFTIDKFFDASSGRMWSDIIWITDRTWGWDTNYAQLRKVSVEAIKKHPKLYLSSVFSDTRFTFRAAYTWKPPPPAGTPPPTASPAAKPPAPETIVVNGRRLPKPTQGDVIPGSRLWWLQSSPDKRVDPNRTPVWLNQADREHFERLQADARELGADLPNRSGSSGLATVLNDLSRVFPRMAIWLLIGILALAVRRPPGLRPLVGLTCLALALILGTLLGMPPALEYRVPLDPIFVLFGLAALTAPRAPSGERHAL